VKAIPFRSLTAVPLSLTKTYIVLKKGLNLSSFVRKLREVFVAMRHATVGLDLEWAVTTLT
jgi:hypothetical protein